MVKLNILPFHPDPLHSFYFLQVPIRMPPPTWVFAMFGPSKCVLANSGPTGRIPSCTSRQSSPLSMSMSASNGLWRCMGPRKRWKRSKNHQFERGGDEDILPVQGDEEEEEKEKNREEGEEEDEDEGNYSSTDKGYVAISLYYLDGPVSNVELKAQVGNAQCWSWMGYWRSWRSGLPGRDAIRTRNRHFWRKVSFGDISEKRRPSSMRGIFWSISGIYPSGFSKIGFCTKLSFISWLSRELCVCLSRPRVRVVL